MKKILTMVLCFSFTLTFSQALKDTEWKTFLTGLDSLFLKFVGTDSVETRWPNGNLTTDSWYEESAGTFKIVHHWTVANTCPITDTGIYTIHIADDTLTFTLISDPCTKRQTGGVPGTKWWRDPTKPTGIESEKDEATIDLYPNPSGGDFVIESSEAGYADIIDMQGKIVHSLRITQGRNEINAELEAGLYMVRLKYEQTSFTIKLLVK